MFYRLFLAGVLCLTAAAVQARGLDISLSDETAQITYLATSDSQIGIGGTDLGFGLFYNENDDVFFNGGILVTGNSLGQNRSLQLGAGARAYAGKLDIPGNDNDTVAAIGIGGKVSYILPARTPMSISIEGYLAPDVTSFGDNEDFSEVTLRFELEVAPTTRFFVGYRSMETELEEGQIDYELDDNAHLGVRFSF